MASFDPPLEAAEIQHAFPDRFVAIAPVYAGGQGSVFRVDRPDGSIGALKIYVPNPGAEIGERTEREVEALRQLDQPSIVRLDAHGEVTIRDETCQFVCTTFIEGQSLSNRLTPAGTTLPLDLVARIGYDIADAVDALWAIPRRIVHRDIKPPNVMLANSGNAVLIDLGVARFTTLESLTLTGATWGTLGYMSPEQAATRKALTCKSDLFTLGVMLQQCLAGRHPTNNNQRALMNGGVQTATLVNGLPAEVEQLIDAMVARDPIRRPMPERVKNVLAAHARPLGRGW